MFSISYYSEMLAIGKVIKSLTQGKNVSRIPSNQRELIKSSLEGNTMGPCVSPHDHCHKTTLKQMSLLYSFTRDETSRTVQLKHTWVKDSLLFLTIICPSIFPPLTCSSTRPFLLPLSPFLLSSQVGRKNS